MLKEDSKLGQIIIQTAGMIICAVIGAVVGPIVVKCFGGGCDNTPRTLTIESIPQTIFAFAGNDNPDGGWSAFSLVYDEKLVPTYRFEFSLPGDKYGYAGLVFQFPKGENLADYRTVEFTLVLMHPDDKVDLFIKDISSNNNSIHVEGNGANEMNLSYNFTNFPDINFNAVKEIGLIANSDYEQGSHELRLKNLRFVK
jgi:hypothetical protein